MTIDRGDRAEDAGSPTPGEPGAASPSATNRTVVVTGLVALAVLLAVVIPALVLSDGDDAGSPQDLLDTAGEAAGDGPVPLADRLGTDDRAPLPDEEFAGFADGPARATTDYRGMPLVLNFWASWCGPCVEEMPDLDALAASTQGRLAVLGVNRADDPAAARALVDDLGVDYDLAVDGDDSLFAAVEAFGMPTTLFVDAEGTIVHRRTGALTADEFVAILGEELGVEVGAEVGAVDVH